MSRKSFALKRWGSSFRRHLAESNTVERANEMLLERRKGERGRERQRQRDRERARERARK
jgi:hypothetical protein